MSATSSMNCQLDFASRCTRWTAQGARLASITREMIVGLLFLRSCLMTSCHASATLTASEVRRGSRRERCAQLLLEFSCQIGGKENFHATLSRGAARWCFSIKILTYAARHRGRGGLLACVLRSLAKIHSDLHCIAERLSAACNRACHQERQAARFCALRSASFDRSWRARSVIVE